MSAFAHRQARRPTWPFLLVTLSVSAVMLALAIGSPATAALAKRSALPPFRSSVAAVTSSEVRYSWRPGCPVPPSALRLVRLSFYGFDGRPHVGTMIVNASVVSAVMTVFSRLYADRFPIRRMIPVDYFHASDPASMAADNTSGFNCRRAVTTGPPQWSVHAYGEAIDVNPVENPYIEGGIVQPVAGAKFLDRSLVRRGMAVPGGALVDAFASVGWYWGGRWIANPDYQHFSSTGG